MEYRPETGAHFSLPSLWVPEGDWHAFRTKELPSDIRSDIEKEEGNQTFFRMFVHPLSQKLYQPLIEKYGLLHDHSATPTSSARTLLVFPNNSKSPFFAKVSLDVVLAGTKRNIPAAEVIRSVGISDYVSKQNTLAPEFQLIPDSFGIVPHDMSRAGQLIRPVPPSVLTNKALPIPLFSLYSPDERGITLFQKWVSESNLSPIEAAKKFITDPFASAWTQWALAGLSHEAHAQNVLLELNPQTERPTGKFFLRDSGGLFLNPKAHIVSKADLASLPAPNGFFWDYQKWADTAENNSLHIFFAGGFLFNLEKELKRLDPNYQAGSLERSFYKKVTEELSHSSGLSKKHFTEDQLKHEMAKVLKLVRESQMGSPTPLLSEKLGKRLRIGFYSGTFDPPHKGHLDLVEAAIKERELDMVIIAPNYVPTFKPEATSYFHRKKMSEMLFNQPKMTLVWDNFERASQQEGSDGVLREILKHYEPDTRVFRIVGNDSFDWFKESGEGVTDPRLVYLVSQRDPNKGSVFPISIRKSPVEVLAFKGEGLSSTEIKKQLTEGFFSQALSPSIQDYIRKTELYSCEKALERLSAK